MKSFIAGLIIGALIPIVIIYRKQIFNFIKGILSKFKK